MRRSRYEIPTDGVKWGKPLQSCLVTGGCGLVGRRLVEMLAEGGVNRVVAFDIADPPAGAEHAHVEWITGDLTKYEDVEQACEGVECVFHIGALVGPYFAAEAYRAVNYQGNLPPALMCV